MPVIVVVFVIGSVEIVLTVGLEKNELFLLTVQVLVVMVLVIDKFAVVNDPLSVEAIGHETLIESEKYGLVTNVYDKPIVFAPFCVTVVITPLAREEMHEFNPVCTAVEIGLFASLVLLTWSNQPWRHLCPSRCR